MQNIHGFFVGYLNGVVDLFTGIYYTIDTNQRVSKTDIIYGTKTTRKSIMESIRNDEPVPDNLIPLFAGDKLAGTILDFKTNTGVWEL